MIGWRIERRYEGSRALLSSTPVLAVLLTLAAGIALFCALGIDAWAALYHYFIEPFETLSSIGEILIKAAPLIMIAVGLGIGFRANVWNIGAEGQLTLGAVASGGVALLFWGHEGSFVLPLMMLAGIAGGMLWAAIPAFLKARLNVNEILTSLMLTYVAGLLLGALVYGPWQAKLAELGTSPEDVFHPTKGRKRQGRDTGKILPVTYRGPQGHTWLGRGHVPTWLPTLEAEGRNRAAFRVQR